ncbi:MAG: hypothetical protein IJB49_09735 [Clostridia bacterium]|nr:hypothetical protein [Clostridia bacterium]
MIFVCALIPISCVAVSLSFGGNTVAAMLLQSLLYLALFGFVKRLGRARVLLAPICIISAALRFCSLFERCRDAVGEFGTAVLVLLCIAAAGFAAYNGASLIHSAPPLFFLTALLCVYIAAVSFADAEFKALPSASVFELISALVCPLSICLAFSRISSYSPEKRFVGGIMGAVVCAVLLLFPKAQAEFGLMCVPLVCFASALEFKAAASVILKPKGA